MRRAFRCFARLSTTSHVTRSSPWLSRLTHYQRSFPSAKCSYRSANFATTGCNAELPNHKRHHDTDAHTVINRDIDPNSWLTSLNKFLPPRLRHHDDGREQKVPNLVEISTILRKAQAATDVDLWLWMVQHGHKKAVIYLMDALLKSVASRAKRNLDKPPSNIIWPDFTFNQIKYASLPNSLSADTHHTQSLAQIFEYSKADLQNDSDFLESVWASLARFVLHAANTTEQDAQDCMTTTMLILGILHNLEMVPDDIYAYKHLDLSSYVQKPPILHLVSSRILTSISDAAWREQQDDAITQATELGVSLKEIIQSVPGGRFRLKVRPLPPEIWLEFILWCSLNGEHGGAAVSTINLLREQTDPWFAIRWCSSLLNENSNALIDWRREKLRHGGSVGLIEGYSREKPFVDVPPRTISIEVVLATIEKLLNHLDVNQQGLPNIDQLYEIQSQIENMISFLEPYDLPSTYFDYLESRLMHIGTFDLASAPSLLQGWSSRVAAMRGLQKMAEAKRTAQNLDYYSILDHSLLQSGVQHQALSALVQAGAVHDALTVFNNIQELVDRNKVRSITEFLQLQVQPHHENGFFTHGAHKYRLEYSDSHGQLPYHQLAAFLNLASEANLTGLGDWLLRADDLDGPLIPEKVYGTSCIALALLKFASTVKDSNLISKVEIATRSERKPAISILRATFDAYLGILDLNSARNVLFTLKRGQGGGYGLSNVVQLGATILRLETRLIGSENTRAAQLAQAKVLMNRLLGGHFDPVRSDFTTTQRALFKQQIAHVLRVFAYCKWSSLHWIAKKHIQNFATGNQASLPIKHFNVLLSAVTDIHGSLVALDMWRLFCREPGATDDDEFREAENISDRSSLGVLSIVDTIATSANSTVPPTNLESGEFTNPFFQAPLEPDVPNIQSSGMAIDYFAGGADDLVDDSSLTMSGKPSGIVDETLSLSDELLEPIRATIPSLSTLRVIVRAAVSEKEAQKASKSDSNAQDEIITWSLNKFQMLGTTMPDILSQEIRQPVSQLDLSAPSRISYIGSKLSGRALRMKQKKASVLWNPGRQQNVASKRAHSSKWS